MSRRLPALALAGWLVFVAVGCGRYGPPKRYPPVGEAPVPVEETAENPTTESKP